MIDPSIDAPFWEALASGEVSMQRCAVCKEVVFPPTPACPHCGGTDLAWTAVGGEGDLYAFTRQHRTAPGVASPVVIGLVALDAGPRVLARIAASADRLTIGTRVALEPWAYDEGVDRGHLADRPFLRAVPVDSEATE